MNNYKLLLEYDGTRYSGWQKQGNTKNTIQAKLEETLERFLGEPIEIHGSGRTDAGVHALGQIANFKTSLTKAPKEIQEYLNNYLPLDIRIISVETASSRFHSRLNAVGKHYQYRIDNGGVANVFTRKYVTRFAEKDYFFRKWTDLCREQKSTNDAASHSSTLINAIPSDKSNVYRQIPYNITAMKQAATLLMGEHDFRSFCDNKRMKKSTVRTITKIDIKEVDGVLTLDFYGNGFLYHMVRILTGTLLEIGIGCLTPEDIPTIIKQKNREAAGFTAPPQGLFLAEVFY